MAEDWEFSDDGVTLTLTMRSGVEFHDGTPVTAEAAMLSIERARDLEGSTVSSGLDVIESMETPDDTTLVINLTEPDAVLPFLLTTMAGTVINPDYLDADLTNGPREATSAPFVAVDFVPNTSLTVERALPHGEHWDADAGHVQRIEWENIDPVSSVTAAQVGEADLAFARVPFEQSEAAVAQNPELVFTVINGETWGGGLWFRNTRSEFDDIRVRQAVVHAVDRELITEQVVRDGCVANRQLAMEGQVGYIDGYDPLPYDPDRARELLEEAGLPDGFTFESTVGDTLNVEQQILEAMQPMLAEVGITMEIRPVATAEQPVIFMQGESDMMNTARGGEPDWSLWLDRLHTRFDLFGPEADEYVPLIEASALPGDDRPERLEAALQAVAESALVVPICYQTSRYLHHERLLGVEDMPLTRQGVYDARNLRWAAD